MTHFFKQNLIKIVFGLFIAICLSACDRYESDLNSIMQYDKTNRIRLFLPVEKEKDGRYIPEYIEIKYVDQQRVLKELDSERKQELIQYLSRSWDWYQPEVVEKAEKSPLKKDDESEEDYKNRIFSLIPEVKSGKKVYRTQQDIQREVWDLFNLESVYRNAGNKDLLFWVTYYGLALSEKDELNFLIFSDKKLHRLEKVLIKEGGKGTCFELGFEASFVIYKKHYLLVFKDFKPELGKKYTLKIKGVYMAKKQYDLERDISVEYNEWRQKEIWWKIDRQVDFYVDETGNCHFENETYLIDETLNPSVNFHSNKHLEIIGSELKHL